MKKKRSNLPMVLGAAAMVAAGSLVYYYFADYTREWLIQHRPTDTENESDLNGMSPERCKSRQPPVSKVRKVVVILSSTIIESQLLKPDTKDQVDLLLFYPTFITHSDPGFPDLAELRKRFVNHPTEVFTLSKPESVKPMLRHLAADEIKSITIIVADEFASLILEDKTISQYVGEVIELPGDLALATQLWNQHVLDL
ncbi:uncharacterized protein V1516DRAFT_690463 [Lipomyces oligophaga]|uniref:uncharacterized protein n=1 Tax=Lipomyces oligophaga TaxID=45792 RepID=UPI0034CE1506